VDRPSDRILVAVDTPDLIQALRWTDQLQGRVGGFKLGLEFLHAAGPAGVHAVQAAGAERIFLDTKLSDIPNTVAGAVRSVGRLRPWMLNVHAMAGPAAMRAAREAAAELGEARPLVVAVTVLTSLDEAALSAIGIQGSPREAVVRLALLAQECGLDGVVASPREVAAIREACGREFLTVIPGVRPAGADTHDQARVATPAAAILAGADYLVVGRAITDAGDPALAAEGIAAEIAAALGAAPPSPVSSG
jgi:orotidine-5'-phosphate decarboxylase